MRYFILILGAGLLAMGLGRGVASVIGLPDVSPNQLAVAMDPNIVQVRLTPNASHNKIGDWHEGRDGVSYLKVYVTTPPENGKANEALIALLAKNWKLPKSAFAIMHGFTDRTKIIRVDGVIPDGNALS
jgi:uncharacterized protein